MKKRLLTLLCIMLTAFSAAVAQRFTDKLDRGLVAVPMANGNLLTWRQLSDEYFDVKYNVYRNNTKITTVTRTNFTDNSGNSSSEYQVAVVVDGVEQEKCNAVKAWNSYTYSNNRSGYLDIALATVYDRTGADVTSNYQPNDAEMADLDGDGQLEIIVKRLNTYDASTAQTGKIYPYASTQFVVLDAYDVDWQTGEATMLWRIDCGPNMVSLNSTEIDIIAYDWDEDGKAEVVLRGADNMIVYGPDGKTQLYTIGSMSVNTRNTFSTDNSQYAWTHTGNEYLIYMNGETGALYQKMTYPLARLESGETNLKTAWGDDYGHRSSKYFFGAPFLDGRKASLFLARGIYTRHKMIAMDLNRATHEWSQRWRWVNNTPGSAWYGQGNHNYVIADVDEDGRDEIVYGSMVIDDNGKGLSSTGLGHGDAMHVSDLDPYRKGLEVFACNEDKPNNNYRNATTSKIYSRSVGSGDDGRAIMANFSNSYPGCQGRSVQGGMISSVSDKEIPAYSGDSFIAWGDLNFRIYWDGDLCSEILNSPGTAKDAKIEKPGSGRLFTTSGCNMNNDSKNNPCFQGDIIGDWREEIVLRCGGNLRVYTTGYTSTFSMPTLWNDHQYRQAMVWQMMAYNQPPHLSYFLGSLEGITTAPPTLTMEGRTEIANGGTISGTSSDQLIMCETDNMTVNVTDGASPKVLFVNAPSWVQGKGSYSGLTNTTYYTHKLEGGAFTGAMRLVKQGDGILEMPNVSETYTGNTDVWAGTLSFDGTLESSALWLNRFTTLLTNGGTFNGGIKADYGSRIIPGGENSKGCINTTTLRLNIGARVVLDIFSDGTADQINATSIIGSTKSTTNWKNFGPQYLAPVIEFVQNGTIADGYYDLGTVGTVVGISTINVEGIENASLELKNGHLMLKVGDVSDTVLSEDDTVAPAATTAAVPLIVNRTIAKDEWATICLPFEMTADEWKSAFGTDAEIRSFNGYEKNGDVIKVKFNTPLTGQLEACKPYVIKTSQDVTSFNITAQIVNGATRDDVLSNSETVAYMEGTLKANTVVPEKNVFISGNKFWYSDGTSSVMKAFRAYFWFKDEVSSSARIVMDLGQTTGISHASMMQSNSDDVYNLSGQRVVTPNKKGLYIKGNKKIIVK